MSQSFFPAVGNLEALIVLAQCPDCQKAMDRGAARCSDCGRNLKDSTPVLRLGRTQLLSGFGRLGYPLLVGMVIWLLVVIMT